MLTGLNLVLMIIGFGLLIFVHELGHFLAAKWADIRTEAFAVGMGPVVLAWRKGIGFVAGSTHNRVVERTGRPAEQLSDEELRQHALGETEYSLRWLPIGGFVKMLGQDDTDPTYRSEHRRSYTRCPIGKRMVVVSGGVIMNVLFAIVLFIGAFMIGVPFEGPVVGSAMRGEPAATTMPDNAQSLGITSPGMQPGDRIIEVNGRPIETFGDLQIASAMARPGEPITVALERVGFDEPLLFTMTPQPDERQEGLQSIGVVRGASSRLIGSDREGQVSRLLERVNLASAGVEPGMKLYEVNGRAVDTYMDLNEAVERSGGDPLTTRWTRVNKAGESVGEPVTATVSVEPELQRMVYPVRNAEEGPGRQFDLGLLGFSPPVSIVNAADGHNADVFEPGDRLARVGRAEFPRQMQLLGLLERQAGDEIEVDVLRGDQRERIEARVNRQGRLGIAISHALDEAITAEPLPEMYEPPATPVEGGTPADDAELVPTAASRLDLLAGTRFAAVNETPVEDWADLRRALREATADAYEAEQHATVTVDVVHPTPGRERESLTWALSYDELRALHDPDLTWTTDLPVVLFEPIYVTLSADGNPFKAAWMGFAETHKFIVLTVMTIDRLIRGSVGVEQLRGPVGIIHVGVQIADRGLLFLVFLLAMISVNLAVINFLPLPIVDGGLFLMLVYEKFAGRPPSVQFQNIITIIGILLIGALFLTVTFYDIARLVG